MSAAAPIRTCVSCRQTAAKPELVRIVRQPDGQVLLDLGGRAPGRGAYLCRKGDCLASSRLSGRLGRALRTDIDQRTWEGLTEAFSKLVPVPAHKEQN